MKIWRVYIIWKKHNESIVRRKNPGKKEKKVKAHPLTVDELQNLLKETDIP